MAWAVALAATLAFKAFVPLLAAVSAEMQGKPVGDVCALYGVRLAATTTPPQHHHHDRRPGAEQPLGQATAVAMVGADDSGPVSHQAPGGGAEHSRDHCALTGLAVCAVSALTPWGTADWGGAVVPLPRTGADIAPSLDASARWLTLRLHAPPTRA